MQIRNQLYILMLLPIMAFAAEKYAPVGMIGSGAGNIIFPQGGQYVYGSPALDGRPQVPAIMVGNYQRHDYVLFSYEEESELLALKDRRLAEYAKKKLVAQRKAYFAKVAKYDWPQMTIKGDEICVPELSSKDATDWKEHLTCYTTTPTGEADDFEFDIPGDPVEKEGS